VAIIFRQSGDFMHARGMIVLVVALVLLAGCGRGSRKADLPVEEKHILKLAALYSDYRAKNGRPPTTIEELKGFAKGLSQQDLAQRGIDDVDKAFISPRDNQPYKVVGPQPRRSGPGAPPPMPMVVIYETTGVNGKRMVASGMGGGAFELDEPRLKEYVPNP
jgi:hypothetical protein